VTTTPRPPQNPGGPAPITPEQIQKLTPVQQRQLAHTFRETAVFLTNITEEDIRKVQAIPWEKIQQTPDPSRPLTEEDKKAYRELWQMVQDGKLTMAQVLGYGQDELYKIYSTGMGLSNQGRFEEALKLAEGLLFLIPSFVPALLLRGEVLRNMGNIDDALKAYDKAVSAEPTFIQGYFERAKLFFAAENMQLFLMDIETVSNLDPEAKTIFGRRARLILEATEKALLEDGLSPDQIEQAEQQLLDAMVSRPAEDLPVIDAAGNQVLKKP
jgi:tetratricopeptide (TPR) repeat protein